MAKKAKIDTKHRKTQARKTLQSLSYSDCKELFEERAVLEILAALSDYLVVNHGNGSGNIIANFDLDRITPSIDPKTVENLLSPLLEQKLGLSNPAAKYLNNTLGMKHGMDFWFKANESYSADAVKAWLEQQSEEARITLDQARSPT